MASLFLSVQLGNPCPNRRCRALHKLPLDPMLMPRSVPSRGILCMKDECFNISETQEKHFGSNTVVV